MPQISIIVPVYNVESYLRECLDSIVSQTFSDWECLLINDGSHDKSGTICDEYAAKDARIRVIHKNNGGVSSARNVALDEIKGKWLTFVDSDDCLYPNALNKWITIAEQNDLDLVQCHINREYKNGQIVGNTTTVLSSLQYAASKDYLVCAGGSLFKSEIVQAHSLRFNESVRLGEDQLFFYNYIQYCSRIQRLGDVLYYYRVNNSSATCHQMTVDILNSLHYFVQFKTHNPSWSAPIDSTLMVFITDMIVNQDITDKKLISIFKQCHIWDYSMMSKTYKLIFILMRLMPHLFIYCLRNWLCNKT